LRAGREAVGLTRSRGDPGRSSFIALGFSERRALTSLPDPLCWVPEIYDDADYDAGPAALDLDGSRIEAPPTLTRSIRVVARVLLPSFAGQPFLGGLRPRALLPPPCFPFASDVRPASAWWSEPWLDDSGTDPRGVANLRGSLEGREEETVSPFGDSW
jgi:hypothetical protein